MTIERHLAEIKATRFGDTVSGECGMPAGNKAEALIDALTNLSNDQVIKLLEASPALYKLVWDFKDELEQTAGERARDERYTRAA